jgi:hypothetical protein
MRRLKPAYGLQKPIEEKEEEEGYLYSISNTKYEIYY